MTMTLSGDGTIGGLVAGGLPDATITQAELASNVAGNGPAFSVTKTSAAQSFTASTWTKVTFNNEEFDTNSCYDTSTSRFTPTVAGYYQITGIAYITSGVAGTNNWTSIYKNGSLFRYSSGIVVSCTTALPIASSLVYLNGSTDYVELYVYSSGTTVSVVNDPLITFFSGALVRAA